MVQEMQSRPCQTTILINESDRTDEQDRKCTMVEIGLAILFVSILVAADRGRHDSLNEKMREFVDWLDRPEE